VLSGEATNTNLIVLGLTRSGLEPMIYRTRDEHAKAKENCLLVSPNIGKILRASRQVYFCFFLRDIANQGFAIYPVKVRKYIIDMAMQTILHHSISFDKCKHFCK
jgi:hypothetical protein